MANTTQLLLLCILFTIAGGYTSVIIVEDAKACYRRVLAGKRVVDRVILRVLPCERLEDCQRECAEERRFDCETFNYRLDPSNRGNGVCELSATPVTLLDVRKDFIEDRDYDFYELDRNSAPDCSLTWPDYRPVGHSHEYSKPPWRPTCQGCQGRWNDNGGWTSLDNNNYNRRHDSSEHYRPWRERPRPYLPQDRNRWDRNFVPYAIAGGYKDTAWGRYGGSYGYGGKHHGHKSAYDYWGLEDDRQYLPNSSYFPVKGVYHYSDYYDGKKKHHGFNYFDLGHKGGSGGYGHKYGYTGVSWSGHHDDHSYEQEEWTGTYPDEFRPFDCSSRSGSGFRISPDLIRKSLSVPDIYECERECFWEPRFQCNSFSYRYTSGPSDNCYLSTRPYHSLDLYNDVQPDRDFDMYAMNPDRRQCLHVHHNRPALIPGPVVGPVPPHYHHEHRDGPPELIGPPIKRPINDRWDSDCFWRVRSGKKLSQHSTRISFVARGIAHCEEECIKLNTFTCRAFSFRHGPPVIGEPEENCHLTDIPLAGLNGQGLSPAPSCELYERGSYGKGCEKNPFSLDTPHHNHLGHGHRQKPTESCYLQYDTSAKLLPEAVRIGARVRTEEDCKRQCATLRGPRSLVSPPPPVPPAFRCMSFSFTSDSSLPPSKDNCLLSDIQLRDLEPGLDYTPSKTHWLFAYNTFDPECSTNEIGFPILEHKKPSSRPEYSPLHPPSYDDDSYKPSRPSYHRPSGPSGHSGPSGPSGHDSVEYSFDSDRRHDDDLGLDTWSYFTVSGWPCRKGTKCAPNKIASYWSCELEGGEVGSWDYCCHPSHKCGHSRGFDQPWCYVGPDREQWRPCSDRYYPYAPVATGSYPSRPWSPRPPGYPDGDRNDLPPHNRPYPPDADRRYWDQLHKDGPQAFYDHNGNPKPGYVRVPTVEKNQIRYHHNYGPDRPSSPHWVPVRLPEDDHQGPSFLDPPRPGGFGVARYWPVAYLHKDGPPNSTYFKSDRESNRHNNIPRPNLDKSNTPVKSDRANNEDNGNNSKPPTREPSTTPKSQILSVGSLERDNSDEKTTERLQATTSTTTQRSVPTSESLVLKSTSSKYSDEDKSPEDSGEILDGKLDRFAGDNTEIIAKGNSNSRLERLRKEEKQIEEIGKVFATIRDRGGIPSDSRSFRPTEDDKTKFESIFVPINLENKERAEKYEPSPKEGIFRSFSARSLDHNPKTVESKTEISSRNFSTLPAIIGFLPADSGRWKFTEESTTPTKAATTTPDYTKLRKTEKSVINSNGQVFYEVPRDETDGKKMARIEKVELQDRSVKVKVANDETNETFESIKAPTQHLEKYVTIPPPSTKRPFEDFAKYVTPKNIPKVEEQSTFIKHLTSSITSTTEKQQFGARTMGKIRKVELPTKNSSLRLVRRGRRNFRIRYDPNEVRKRLLEKKKTESGERLY